jgi:hypothetical protein
MAAPARDQGLSTTGAPRPHSTGRFFASVRALSGAAARVTGRTDLHYRIAGRRVLVRSAGSELVVRTDPALGIRRDGDAPGSSVQVPDLTVDLWDSATSGVAMPRAPWHPTDLAPLGLVRGYCDERYLTALDVHTASLSVFDAVTSHGVFWLHDARRMAYWQSASPLRLVLSWWGSTRGMQLTHAGAVATPDGAVLLVGGAGAGKSTTALTCLHAGLDFFGDDYCLVAPEPTPWVHGVFATAKLRPDSLLLLPALGPMVRNAEHLDHQKAILDLGDAHAARLAAGAPIRAIVVPRVSDRVRAVPITPGAALRAMAPSTIFGLFGATPGSLHLLAGLARDVPAFRLDVGSDLDAVVEAVAALAATR